MKYRESGMPDEKMWKTFFNPQQILSQLGVDRKTKTLLDIGCGYGTFLIPAASLVGEKVIGIDIENEMIEACRAKAKDKKLPNVDLVCGDFSDRNVRRRLEKQKNGIDYVCLFNILHCENPSHF